MVRFKLPPMFQPKKVKILKWAFQPKSHHVEGETSNLAWNVQVSPGDSNNLGFVLRAQSGVPKTVESRYNEMRPVTPQLGWPVMQLWHLVGESLELSWFIHQFGFTDAILPRCFTVGDTLHRSKIVLATECVSTQVFGESTAVVKKRCWWSGHSMESCHCPVIVVS